jgi:hypothetical protein
MLANLNDESRPMVRPPAQVRVSATRRGRSLTPQATGDGRTPQLQVGATVTAADRVCAHVPRCDLKQGPAFETGAEEGHLV